MVGSFAIRAHVAKKVLKLALEIVLALSQVRSALALALLSALALSPLPLSALAALCLLILVALFAFVSLLRPEGVVQKLLLLPQDIGHAVEALHALFVLLFRAAFRGLDRFQDVAQLVQHLGGGIGRP